MFRRIYRNDAVSTVVAVVLLVAMTVLLAAIIYMWVASYGSSKSPPRVYGELSFPTPDTCKIYLKTNDKGSLEDLKYLLQKNSTTFESGKLSEVYNQNLSVRGNVSFVDMDNDGFLSDGDSVLVKKQDDTASAYTFKLIFVPTSDTILSMDLVVK